MEQKSVYGESKEQRGHIGEKKERLEIQGVVECEMEREIRILWNEGCR